MWDGSPAIKKKIKLPKALSKGEETLALQLKAEKIPFEREFMFHEKRKWRFDFIAREIGIEIHGGIWNKGAHVRGKQFESDCLKKAEAVILGYRVMEFTTDQVTKGIAIDCIKRAIA